MPKRPVREILVVLSLLAVVVPRNSFGINSQPSPTAEDGSGDSVAVCPFYKLGKDELDSAAKLFPEVVATNCTPTVPNPEPQPSAIGQAFIASTLAAMNRETAPEKPLFFGVTVSTEEISVPPGGGDGATVAEIAATTQDSMTLNVTSNGQSDTEVAVSFSSAPIVTQGEPSSNAEEEASTE